MKGNQCYKLLLGTLSIHKPTQSCNLASRGIILMGEFNEEPEIDYRNEFEKQYEEGEILGEV